MNVTSYHPNWRKIQTSQSVEGREIALFLSQPDVESLDTLILGLFHGDEAEAKVVVETFLRDIDPAGLSETVGAVPVVNPDGFARETRQNANGVDLNRNFPTADWAELNADTIYYSGSGAASEPETQFLLTIIGQYTPKKIITVHTPYAVLNFDGPAKALAEAMSHENGYPVVEDIGYATPGSFGTYVGKERGIPTVTLELAEKEAFTDDSLVQNVAALVAGIRW